MFVGFSRTIWLKPKSLLLSYPPAKAGGNSINFQDTAPESKAEYNNPTSGLIMNPEQSLQPTESKPKTRNSKLLYAYD
jgi:hypothetical protein